MVITMKQVIAVISPEEPDYNKAARLGTKALPHLEKIIKTADPMLAAKATSLVAHIQDEKSVNILMIAAQSRYTLVRVAAAAGSRNLRLASVDRVLNVIKDDQDEGVRKQALKSIKSIKSVHRD